MASNDEVEWRAVPEAPSYGTLSACNSLRPTKLPACPLQPFVRRRMSRRIPIKESPDHSLILCAMTPRFGTKESYAALGQCDGYLLSIFTIYKLRRRGQKVIHHPKATEGFVGVFDSFARKSSYLSANSRRQGF